MKRSRVLAFTLAVFMMLAAFVGCTSESPSALGDNNSPAPGGASSDPGSDNEINHNDRPEITIDVYSQLVNYAGMQVGWFAKLVKDRFNINMNIIDSSDDNTFTTRMISGNLGDLIAFGNNGNEYLDAIDAGMLLDWYADDILDIYGPDIKRNMATALKQNAETFGGGTKCYGFGHNVASTADAAEAFFYHPDIRYDLYQAIGSPEVRNLDGYIDVLRQMMDYEPYGESGLPSYGFSLFNDWDGDMIMSVKCLGAFYGYDEFGFGLYDVNTNTFQPMFDDNSMYLQALKFFNKAYRAGILDPDSMTQSFSDVSEKYKDGRVYYSLFTWLGADNYNTEERLAEGKGMFAVPAMDQKNICYAMNTLGGNRPWAIGAQAKHPERIMELINWMATPEGLMECHYGPKGVTWDYDADGKAYFTELGYSCQADPSTVMPAEVGGGTYQDGERKINNTTYTIDDINPLTGERYNKDFWSSWLTRDPNPAFKAWQDGMNAAHPEEYLERYGMKSVAIIGDFVMGDRSPELEATWSDVKYKGRDLGWLAIYAETDAEYDAIVADMIAQCKALGYDECIAWNRERAEARADAVRRALAR